MASTKQCCDTLGMLLLQRADGTDPGTTTHECLARTATRSPPHRHRSTHTRLPHGSRFCLRRQTRPKLDTVLPLVTWHGTVERQHVAQVFREGAHWAHGGAIPGILFHTQLQCAQHDGCLMCIHMVSQNGCMMFSLRDHTGR